MKKEKPVLQPLIINMFHNLGKMVHAQSSGVLQETIEFRVLQMVCKCLNIHLLELASVRTGRTFSVRRNLVRRSRGKTLANLLKNILIQNGNAKRIAKFYQNACMKAAHTEGVTKLRPNIAIVDIFVQQIRKIALHISCKQTAERTTAVLKGITEVKVERRYSLFRSLPHRHFPGV